VDVARDSGFPIRVAGRAHPEDQAFARRELRARLAEPHVTYCGAVTQTEKRPLLRDARALLAPIEWNEPFGLILIEAMLSGCPVIAFPRGSVPELVDEGITGFLVNSADEMARVIRTGGPLDVFDRRRCRRRAVDRFSRARMVRDYERLYRTISAVPSSPSESRRQTQDRRRWNRAPAQRRRGERGPQTFPEST
jgi:glycosyltransferase involved in cell wall biosynthesis